MNRFPDPHFIAVVCDCFVVEIVVPGISVLLVDYPQSDKWPSFFSLRKNFSSRLMGLVFVGEHFV